MQKPGQGPDPAGSICPAEGLCPESSLHVSGWMGAAPRCRGASTPLAPGSSFCLRLISTL